MNPENHHSVWWPDLKWILRITTLSDDQILIESWDTTFYDDQVLSESWESPLYDDQILSESWESPLFMMTRSQVNLETHHFLWWPDLKWILRITTLYDDIFSESWESPLFMMTRSCFPLSTMKIDVAVHSSDCYNFFFFLLIETKTFLCFYSNYNFTQCWCL